MLRKRALNSVLPHEDLSQLLERAILGLNKEEVDESDLQDILQDGESVFSNPWTSVCTGEVLTQKMKRK